jgi:hypothetical protein
VFSPFQISIVGHGSCVYGRGFCSVVGVQNQSLSAVNQINVMNIGKIEIFGFSPKAGT